MAQYTYLTDLAYAYLGLLIAFSVAQLLMLHSHNKIQVLLWVCASFFSAIGTAFAPHLLTVISVAHFGVWGGIAALLGGVFRFFALSYRQRSFARDKLAWLFLFLSLAGLPFAAMPQASEYRLLISSFVGASISAACFFAALRNRFWRTKNKLGRRAVLIGMGLSCVVLIGRGLTSYPFGPDQIFVGESVLQKRAMELLVLISFFLQVGFTGMLVSRRNEERLFADRRAVRLSQRTIRLRKRSQELLQTSRERLDLIQLLTHEVRQPISNAQASLQSINNYLKTATRRSPKAAIALQRAQSSLDSITLALSNIIVAMTLVSHERKWEPQEIDAGAMLEMARLDCRPEQQARIVTREKDAQIFLLSVPILLRVALQNLLEQALNLSVPKREIYVELSVDPNSELVVFDVRFISNRLDLIGKDVFKRRSGSDTERSELSPLGLFVVHQVARELSGEIRLLSPQSGQLSFQLSLPY